MGFLSCFILYFVFCFQNDEDHGTADNDHGNDGQNDPKYRIVLSAGGRCGIGRLRFLAWSGNQLVGKRLVVFPVDLCLDVKPIFAEIDISDLGGGGNGLRSGAPVGLGVEGQIFV